MLVANAQLRRREGTIILHVGDLPAVCEFVLGRDLGVEQPCYYQSKNVCSARLSQLD